MAERIEPEIFIHKFGGWCDAKAVRRPNPDGSPGAVVATSATVHPSVNLPQTVEIWPDATVGYRATVGDGATVGEGAEYLVDDWLFVAGPQGSRIAWATAVWSSKHGLRWWVGCRWGLTSEELRSAVRQKHGDDPYAEDYLYLIDLVEKHPGLAWHIAARKEEAA